MIRTAWIVVIAVVTWPLIAAGAGAVRTGEVRFEPSADEASLPEFFRLAPHDFTFREEPQPTSSSKIAVSLITFPSPVETPHPRNNTVHCEYFRPLSPGKHPAVVVLHILGGDFDLARLFCRHLSSNGVAALFLKMPDYGPRRDPASPVRMISDDPRATVESMKQAVKDIRRGAAWLAAQQEVDPNRLGIFGISLVGITGALAATIEPRITNVCLMLAGGDIAQIGWTSPELARWRTRWQDAGGDKESFFQLLKDIDPITYADRVRGRRVLMLNASRDEVIPRSCTDSLWHAFGEPEIVWLDAGHYSAMRFIFDGLGRVTRFFQAGDKH